MKRCVPTVRGGDYNASWYEQFFTQYNTVLNCVTSVQEVLNDSCLAHFALIVEPCFGEGVFVDVLMDWHEVPRDRILCIDIDARDDELRKDFLTEAVAPKNHPVLTIGNPPFGKNASLAVAFFNHAASYNSDLIAFVLPRTFCKPSFQNKLSRSYFKINGDGYVLPHNSFVFKGKPYDVPAVFQVWSHVDFLPQTKASIVIPVTKQRLLDITMASTPDFTFVKEGAADVAIRRVGANAGRIFESDFGKCSFQSHLFLVFSDKSRRSEIIENLKKMDLEHIACRYDTAGCPSLSKSEICKKYIELYGHN